VIMAAKIRRFTDRSDQVSHELKPMRKILIIFSPLTVSG